MTKNTGASPTNHTALASCGLFPVGTVYLPTTPPINATTVVAKDFESLAEIDQRTLTALSSDVYENFYYGGVGTPTTLKLAMEIARLEGASYAALTPSGQSAISAVLLALTSVGDHILVGSTVTYSTKWFLERRLAHMGVVVEYFSPDEVETIEASFRDNTRLVLFENPGSMTYEMMDPKQIVSAARGRDIITILDNTWAASSFFKPFDVGIDISVLSLSKSHAGPAGVSLGAVVTNSSELYALVRTEAAVCGLHVSPHACSDALTSMATMGVRLDHQSATTRAVIDLLQAEPSISTVYHPSLAGAPGHSVWKANYTGYNSLVSVSFERLSRDDIIAFINKLTVIRIGYGWGGLISLISLFDSVGFGPVPDRDRPVTHARFYLGLEDKDDLQADLSAAFGSLRGRT